MANTPTSLRGAPRPLAHEHPTAPQRRALEEIASAGGTARERDTMRGGTRRIYLGASGTTRATFTPTLFDTIKRLGWLEQTARALGDYYLTYRITPAGDAALAADVRRTRGWEPSAVQRYLLQRIADADAAGRSLMRWKLPRSDVLSLRALLEREMVELFSDAEHEQRVRLTDAGRALRATFR